MRAGLGLIVLLLALGVVALLARNQLGATKLPAVSLPAASGPGVALDPMGGASAAQAWQGGMRDALQQQTDHRGDAADAPDAAASR